MTIEALLKAVTDLGAIGAFVWFVIMFQRGEIVSRVTVERIITEVTTRTISEISTRIIVAVQAQLENHGEDTASAHNKILDQLNGLDKVMSEIEKTTDEIEKTLEKKRQW